MIFVTDLPLTGPDLNLGNFQLNLSWNPRLMLCRHNSIKFVLIKRLKNANNKKVYILCDNSAQLWKFGAFLKIQISINTMFCVMQMWIFEHCCLWRFNKITFINTNVKTCRDLRLAVWKLHCLSTVMWSEMKQGTRMRRGHHLPPLWLTKHLAVI